MVQKLPIIIHLICALRSNSVVENSINSIILINHSYQRQQQQRKRTKTTAAMALGNKRNNLLSFGSIVDAVKESYKSRKKNRNELPIVEYFIIHYNQLIASGWLNLILSKELILCSLLAFFFYGGNRPQIFLTAAGIGFTNIDNI